MQDKNLNIYIISEDIMFIQLIETMLRHYTAVPIIKVFNSFHKLLNNTSNISPNIIIMDDIISGATSLEVISYLRITKKYISKISFFSYNVYGIRTKALARGINYFYSKPFDPQLVVGQIVKDAHSKTR